MNKILLIDDEPLIRDGLKQILELKGYTVKTASDGKEAIQYLNNNCPDIVITDIIMPERDGIEVIISVKKKYPEVRIIAISGGGRINAQDHLEIAKQLGVDNTLTKPFSSDELLFIIESYKN